MQSKENVIHFLGTGICVKKGSEICIKYIGEPITKICKITEVLDTAIVVSSWEQDKDIKVELRELETIDGVPTNSSCIEVIKL